jgi:hypothetical protein
MDFFLWKAVEKEGRLGMNVVAGQARLYSLAVSIDKIPAHSNFGSGLF